ncbi:hypothetical protein AAG570_009855 [Ranatra chinensis]|uniref:Uncharacterized protein n=1 Tax=Ranatra chinensis TaxID=642074 RepID=A0ABD0Z7E0_9HEMI
MAMSRNRFSKQWTTDHGRLTGKKTRWHKMKVIITRVRRLPPNVRSLVPVKAARHNIFQMWVVTSTPPLTMVETYRIRVREFSKMTEDTFTFRVPVNGEILKRNVGKHVSLTGKVVSVSVHP